MFEIPSDADIEKVTITKDCITGETPPTINKRSLELGVGNEELEVG
jgi:ATP-dependent protease Clp ATPase subunit